jgi:hypothetical protein
MAQDVVQNDLIVVGAFSCKQFTPPAGSIGDAAVLLPSPSSAGIQTNKLKHRWQDEYVQGSSTTTAASDQKVVHVVRGTTGTLLDFKAGCITPNVGAATITVDLWKNGVTILTAVITLNNSQTARQLVAAGGFTSTALAVGDVLEAKVVATIGGGTLGIGLFALLSIDEDPS